MKMLVRIERQTTEMPKQKAFKMKNMLKRFRVLLHDVLKNARKNRCDVKS